MSHYRHLYGPVLSRRLGRSLGVDLAPHKICTYDCVYCQIGKTTDRTLLRKEYVPAEEILEEIRVFLHEGHSAADFLSLGGSGEPTLHSKIRSIIEGVRAISLLPVAVITNGSLLCEQEVREDLLRADVVLPSMDAVSQRVFEMVNRPCPGFSAVRVIEGLIQFRRVYRGRIWLEILFCKGINDTEGEILLMKEVMARIRPDLIHLNTVVRPPSESWAKPLAQAEMERLKTFFGERASVISEFDRPILPPPRTEMTGELLNILKRRPLSISDLCRLMGLARDQLETHLQPLIAEGKVRIHSFQDSVFYEAAPD